MSAQTARLARLQRAIEYDGVMHETERVIRWAKANGHMSDACEQDCRADLAAIAGPREKYIAGRWQPPPAVSMAPDATCPVLILDYVEAWEAAQGVAPGVGS